MLSGELIEGSRPFVDEEPFAGQIEVIETQVGDLGARERMHPREQDDEPVIGTTDVLKERATRRWINAKRRPGSRRL